MLRCTCTLEWAKVIEAWNIFAQFAIVFYSLLNELCRHFTLEWLYSYFKIIYHRIYTVNKKSFINLIMSNKIDLNICIFIQLYLISCIVLKHVLSLIIIELNDEIIKS